ncbi:hypothetical protein PZA11_004508 [Diplocarpon coronariae]
MAEQEVLLEIPFASFGDLVKRQAALNQTAQDLLRMTSPIRLQDWTEVPKDVRAQSVSWTKHGSKLCMIGDSMISGEDDRQQLMGGLLAYQYALEPRQIVTCHPVTRGKNPSEIFI